MGTLRLNENGDIISKNRHEMQLGVRFHRLQMPRASRLRRAAVDICNRFCATRPGGTARSGHDKPPDGMPTGTAMSQATRPPFPKRENRAFARF